MELSDIAAREMPHSVEAEQTVLGAVLMDPDQLSVVMDHVKAESFYVKIHRQIFSIIVRRFGMGETADIITVLDEAVREGVFESWMQCFEIFGTAI